MNWLIFGIAAIFTAAGIICIEEYDRNFIGTLLIMFGGIFCYMSAEYDKPEPIDVYRGKTDLEITYKIKNNDTISCDTTVVWK